MAMSELLRNLTKPGLTFTGDDTTFTADFLVIKFVKDEANKNTVTLTHKGLILKIIEYTGENQPSRWQTFVRSMELVPLDCGDAPLPFHQQWC